MTCKNNFFLKLHKLHLPNISDLLSSNEDSSICSECFHGQNLTQLLQHIIAHFINAMLELYHCLEEQHSKIK